MVHLWTDAERDGQSSLQGRIKIASSKKSAWEAKEQDLHNLADPTNAHETFERLQRPTSRTFGTRCREFPTLWAVKTDISDITTITSWAASAVSGSGHSEMGAQRPSRQFRYRNATFLSCPRRRVLFKRGKAQFEPLVT